MVCYVRNPNLDNTFGLALVGHEKDLSSNRWTALRIDTFVLSLSYQFSNYF